MIMDNKNDKVSKGSFHIEVDKKETIKKITDYFLSKNIQTNDIKAENELDNIKIYKCTFDINENNLMAIDTLCNNLSKIDENHFIKFKNLSYNNIFGETLEKLIQKEKKLKIIKYKIKYHEYAKFNYVKEPGGIGLELIDKAAIEASDKVMGSMIKTLGKNILNGKELTSIALPIFINDERSMIETMMLNIFNYIVPAVDEMKIERLKLITTNIISSTSNAIYGWKPFNPILGETFQATIVPYDYDTNSNYSPIDIYVEQIKHHPPIYNYYGKHDKFEFYGYRETSVKGGGNSIEAQILGNSVFKFNDGTKIVITYPRFSFSGLLVGPKMFNFNGYFVVHDQTNGLKSIIALGKNSVDKINKKKSSLIGNIFKKKELNFPDYFKGFIAADSNINYDKKSDTYSVNDEDCLCKFEGEYTNYITFDGKVYWNNEENNKLAVFKKHNFTIPSDCRLRSDILLYKDKKIDLAQCAKMMLEDLQRRDCKLRKKYTK